MGVNDGFTVLSGSPPVVNSAGGAVSNNPFGSVGAYRETSFRLIIDTARTRHWAFATQNMPDGAAFANLRLRQRELLAQAGAEIEGLVGATIQYAVNSTALSGSLLQLLNGVPVVAAPGADGWPIHLDGNGIAFFDPTEPMLAGDPLQQRVGGLQGFPLPMSMIRLIDVKAIWANGLYQAINVVDERRRVDAIPDRNLVAFISNNRLVPMLFGNQSQNAQCTAWQAIAAIQVSYVPLPSPLTLDELVLMPDVLVGVLVAYVSKLFAMQAREVSVAERTMFRSEEDRAIKDFLEASQGMLSSPADNDVQMTSFL